MAIRTTKPATKSNARRSAPVAKASQLKPGGIFMDEDFTYGLPPAGEYVGMLSELTDFRVNEAKQGKNKGRKFVGAQVDAKISPESESYPGFKIRFQRLNHWQIRDLLKGFGLEREEIQKLDEEGIKQTLLDAVESETTFPFFGDWRLFSVAARNQKLRELTNTDTDDEAKNAANSEQYNAANEFATIYTTESEFPEVDGKRVTVVECPHTGEELYGNFEIRRFLQTA